MRSYYEITFTVTCRAIKMVLQISSLVSNGRSNTVYCTLKLKLDFGLMDPLVWIEEAAQWLVKVFRTDQCCKIAFDFRQKPTSSIDFEISP